MLVRHGRSCSVAPVSANRLARRVLFEDLSLSLSDGDRTGLIGPNGSGKTTLLEILAGNEAPDAGIRALRKQARVAYVPQDSLFAPDDTVGSVLRRGAGRSASGGTGEDGLAWR